MLGELKQKEKLLNYALPFYFILFFFGPPLCITFYYSYITTYTFNPCNVTSKPPISRVKCGFILYSHVVFLVSLKRITTIFEFDLLLFSFIASPTIDPSFLSYFGQTHNMNHPPYIHLLYGYFYTLTCGIYFFKNDHAHAEFISYIYIYIHLINFFVSKWWLMTFAILS